MRDVVELYEYLRQEGARSLAVEKRQQYHPTRVLLRREQFVREQGTDEWPDGTLATCYGFLHAVFQETLYEQVPIGRRAHFHQRIGEREEAAYGEGRRTKLSVCCPIFTTGSLKALTRLIYRRPGQC